MPLGKLTFLQQPPAPTTSINQKSSCYIVSPYFQATTRLQFEGGWQHLGTYLLAIPHKKKPSTRKRFKSATTKLVGSCQIKKSLHLITISILSLRKVPIDWKLPISFFLLLDKKIVFLQSLVVYQENLGSNKVAASSDMVSTRQ